MTVAPPAPDFCTEVTPECPVEGTLYGYAPNIGANAFFAAFFGICLVIQLVLGVRSKTWTYMIAMGFCCLGELIGYIGRIMLWKNPFDDIGFQIQICCLIIAPAFVSGAIYLTLKHIVLSFGAEWSRLRPAWYTYIFIAGDLLSLILQGAGGGLAATADPGSSLQDVGTNLMIAGVIWQVVCLAIFGYFLAEYGIRTNRRRSQLDPEAWALFKDTKFRAFMIALVTAYVAVFVRCVYRIPELTGGWRSELMRNEPEFIVLEGVMIVIAVGALTIFHPGFCFPVLGNTFAKSNNAKSASASKYLEDTSSGDVELANRR
ncbi:sphingoid long-chain base transporter RSB1 [Aaosphaeria arxii CBS 175.79]|uniref:Sphingoid long-chain base transporter RSB1 n=1 Tax=Aaosphaeria arxii CBS 175.79 TaxID=1450172 RepID=A0A6A5X920_9PLEO|nr:sphingoid long-chain base transporter RSB1 [Aaosphaeria arxii CBS 175.79]KAF2009399.1 sphingoid long-chain base transporter RSB1 [Aaosphaeria arxii CBS 175.79]